MDRQKDTISQVNCAIENLVLKINQEEQRDFEKIIEAIAQLGRWCRNNTAFKATVVQYFVEHPEAIGALVTMVKDICTG